MHNNQITLGFASRNKPRSGLLSMKLTESFFFVAILILLFESSLQQVFPVFGYFDELSTLLFGCAALVKLSVATAKTQENVWLRRVVGCLIALAALGFLGTAFSDYNPPFIAVAIDVLTCFKFFIAFGAAMVLLSDSSNLLNALARLARVLVIALFACACVSLFVDIGMGGEIRYGIPSFKFLFFHPGVVVWFTVALTALLLTDSKRNKVFIFLALAVVCLTLRSKGICWAVVMLILVTSTGKDGHIKAWHVLVASLAVLYLSYDNIQLYYNNENIETARAALQRVSFDVASDYFPWGSGYASFGSAITADQEYYSPLYFKYGLSTVWGIIPSHPQYISDTFWPTVISQFGWIGLILFLMTLACFFGFVRSELEKKPPMLWVSSLGLLAYLLLGSIAESSFFNPSAVYFALILAVIVNSSPSEQPSLPSHVYGGRK